MFSCIKLHKFITEQLDLPIKKTIFWTDSTIVLQYIRNEARRFQMFVANQLLVIDDASRGFSSSETQNLKNWFKRPMIPPSKHHVTDLVIRDCHEKEDQVGAGQVLTSIRQKFWILRGHAAVWRVVGKCLKCQFWNARPSKQIMAPLPTARVSPGLPPFSSIGVD